MNDEMFTGENNDVTENNEVAENAETPAQNEAEVLSEQSENTMPSADTENNLSSEAYTAPIYEAPIPDFAIPEAPKTPIFKRRGFWIAVISALVAVTVAWVIAANTSKAVAFSALNDMIEPIAENDLVEVISESLTDGRITLGVEKGDVANFDGKIDVYRDWSDGVVSAELEGETATLYLIGDNCILESSLLDDRYGFNLKTLLDDIDEAEFLDKTTRKEIKKYIRNLCGEHDNIAEVKKSSKKSADGAQKYLNKYSKKFLNDLFKNAKVSNQITKTGDRVVVIRIDEKALANTVKSVWAEMYDDKQFIKFLDEYYPASNISGYDSWSKIFKEINREIKDICNDIKDEEFDIEINITAGLIMHGFKKLTVELSYDDEYYIFTVDGREKNVTSIYVDAAHGEERVYNIFELIIESKGDNYYIDLYIDGENGKITWEYDKKSGDFELTVEDNKGSVKEATVYGSFESSGKRVYIKVDKITTPEDTIYPSVYFEAVKGEKLPKAPKKYENIFELTERDIENIGKDLEKEFKKLEDLF